MAEPAVWSTAQFPVGKPLSPVLNESATDNRRQHSANFRGETRNERPLLEPLVSTNQLATQTKLGDDGTVALHIILLDVVEHATATANHGQQTTATVVVLLVAFQVARKVVDALRQDGNLHFGGTRIGCVKLVRGNRCLFVWQVKELSCDPPSKGRVAGGNRITSQRGPQRT